MVQLQRPKRVAENRARIPGDIPWPYMGLEYPFEYPFGLLFDDYCTSIYRQLIRS